MSTSTSSKITKYFSLEVDFELNFCINKGKAFTTNKLPRLKGESSTSDSKNHLAIEIWCELGSIDSFHDGNLYARATILTLLSVISYLVDYPLTIYQVTSSITEADVDEEPNRIEVLNFIHDQVDKSSDLLKILEAIYLREDNISKFVVSALSRWHKARYLEEESQANLYGEESFLVYFHIIELCSNCYGKEQSDEAKDKIKRFTKELFENTLKFRDSHLEQMSQEKYKAISLILLSDGQIPITSKLCYFLDRVNLLDPQTQYFTEQLVKIRNTIAHGRHVNHAKLNWPLPPFLPINLDADRYIFEIRVFTGRIIGAFLKIEAWSVNWTDIHDDLHPPTEYVKKFIHNKSFESVTKDDFVKGGIDNVRPTSLLEQFLLKKISLSEFEMGLRSFLLNAEVDEDNVFEIFEAAIILADSSDEKLSSKCRNIVADVYENELAWDSSMKNILREIERKGIKPVWFREWIENDFNHEQDRKWC
jgi:hypothetical protein